MAIEIIPKKAEAKFPTAINILFYSSLTLLIISVLSYFVLTLLQRNSSKTLQNIEESLIQKETAEIKALEKKIFGYQKKIDDFSTLLNRHQSSSNFFIFLENLSHPKVSFSKVELNTEKGQASLSGQTESFETLGQQLLIFKKEKFVKNINLSEVSISKEGEIEFTLELSFSPALFQK